MTENSESTRAQHLAQYLQSHGWTIYEIGERRFCVCDTNIDHPHNAMFCYKCGSVLLTMNSDTIAELEKGLQYALGEDNVEKV